MIQTTNMSSEEMQRTMNHLLSQMDQTFQDLRKKLEDEKIKAEQERLRKIQVCFPRERFGERVSIRKYSSVPPGKAQGRGVHGKILVCFPG